MLDKRYIQQKYNSIETRQIADICYNVAGIEIFNILKQDLDDPSQKIVTIVTVEKLYRELLLELGLKEEDLHNSYRKHLKRFILENVPGVLFKKSTHANGPEIVFRSKCATEGMPKKNIIKMISDIFTLVVMQSFFCKRQVTYEPKTSVERESMYSLIETPLNVGVRLYLHQTTRSKKLIDMFSGLNLRISYER